jgi:hypothetical protein
MGQKSAGDPFGGASKSIEVFVKTKSFAALGNGIALVAALSFVVSAPAFAQAQFEKAFPSSR